MKKAWRVDIIESERGWGQKIDETIYFENKVKAEEFVKTHNARNNEAVVPDIYWRADGPYLVTFPDNKDIRR